MLVSPGAAKAIENELPPLSIQPIVRAVPPAIAAAAADDVMPDVPSHTPLPRPERRSATRAACAMPPAATVIREPPTSSRPPVA